MKSTVPLVHAVVVTFNGKRFLDDCLAALVKTRYGNLRIVLLDNGSSDGSGQYARERFPQVQVVRQEPNAGYAGGVNRGIDRALAAGAEYVAVFNDDTAVLDPRWLSAAVEQCEREQDVGMVGFHMSGSLDDAPLIAPARAKDVAYLHGFALVIRRSLLDTVGTYDEIYGVYADEDDLEARARAAGYRLKELNLPIFHHGSGTNGAFSRHSAYLQMRNGIRFCLKNHGVGRAVGRALRIVDVACNPWPLSINRADIGHQRMRNTGNVFRNAWTCLCAVAWNVRHLPETLRTRRRDRRRYEQARVELQRELQSQGPDRDAAFRNAPAAGQDRTESSRQNLVNAASNETPSSP